MNIKKIISLLFLISSSTVLIACDDVDNTFTDSPIQNENCDTQISQTPSNSEEERNENQLLHKDNNNNKEITNESFENKKEQNNDTTNKYEEYNNESPSKDSNATITPKDDKKDLLENKKNVSEPLKGEDGSDGLRNWHYESQLSIDTFNAINNYRKENGIHELKWSNTEWERANKWALMNAQKEDADHDFEQVSIKTGFDSTADEFLSRWKNSASHNKSILRTTEQEGAVAVYKDSNNIYYVVASYTDNWGKNKDTVEIPFIIY